MRNFINRLLGINRPQTITISFITHADGSVTTTSKISKNLPVSRALYGLDRVRNSIAAGVSNKAQAKGLTHKNPKTRGFIANIKVGDII